MARLPAHLEASALIRETESLGGFAAVLHRGERDAGTILVVALENGANPSVYERMPSLDGTRNWTRVELQDTDNQLFLSDWLERRRNRDPDLWIVELDIAHGERLAAILQSVG